MTTTSSSKGTSFVVLEDLEPSLRKKWLELLIANEQIEFSPLDSPPGTQHLQTSSSRSSRQSYYSADVRLVTGASAVPPEEHIVDDALTRKILLALRSVNNKEQVGERLPPYAKFCALLAWTGSSTVMNGQGSGASSKPHRQQQLETQQRKGGGDPRKRSVQWVIRKTEEIYVAKETSLRLLDPSQQQDDVLSFSNIFPVFVFEHFCKSFGLRHLVEQTSWDFVYSVHAHRRASAEIDLFARFLDEQYNADDLLFFLHAREAISKYKRVDSGSFRSRAEVLAFASQAHPANAEFLRKSFIGRLDELQILPSSSSTLAVPVVDVHTILKIAVENYHQAAGATTVQCPAQQHQQHVHQKHDDARTIDEIVDMQERIRKQLEGILRSSPASPPSPAPPPPASKYGDGQTTPPRQLHHLQGRSPPKRSPSSPVTTPLSTPLLQPRKSMTPPSMMAATTTATTAKQRMSSRNLPAIQTRSPEDSSASSASPRSHGFVSPQHQQFYSFTHNNSSSSPPHSKDVSTTRLKSSFFFDVMQQQERSMQEHPVVAQVDHVDIALPMERQQTVLLASVEQSSEEEEVSAITSRNNDDDDDEDALMTTAVGEDQSPSYDAEADPTVSLQRAVAKQGATFLDRWMATSVQASSAKTSPTVSQRVSARREAADVLSRKTSRILDQVMQPAAHVHASPDCSPTYCPFAELRTMYHQKIAKLARGKKPFASQVQDLAKRIVDSTMVKREMESLLERQRARQLQNS